jgi:hypothetical protein
MVLREQQYAISSPYIATRDDVFDIFRILKALKEMIDGFVTEDSADTEILVQSPGGEL